MFSIIGVFMYLISQYQTRTRKARDGAALIKVPEFLWILTFKPKSPSLPKYVMDVHVFWGACLVYLVVVSELICFLFKFNRGILGVLMFLSLILSLIIRVYSLRLFEYKLEND